MAVMRRILKEVLSAEPDLEVVASAQDGRVALEKLELTKPDIVILDFDMPQMNGLETLTEIRKAHARLPVILFSALTEKGARVTLEALSRGADDYITKPEGAGGPQEGLERIRRELVPRIRALVPARLGPEGGGQSPAPLPTEPGQSVIAPRRVAGRPASGSRVEVLAIGISTGGPNALGTVLPRLPADFPVPVVIVQHMPKIFTKLLAERLNSKCKLRVYEGESGQRVHAGGIWIAPGDQHMVLRREGREVRLETFMGEAVNYCRPSVDVLFESATKTYGGGVLGLVMTGMGQDGLHGSRAIRDAGGQVLVQDAASSVVWGMPGAVAGAGLADEVLSLELIPEGILRRVGGPGIYAQ